jgi:cation transport regulator ChaC
MAKSLESKKYPRRKMSSKTEPMRISPHFTCDDWTDMAFSKEEEWQKAIDIFEDRIDGRFMKIIGRIEGYEFSGFAVLALDSLLIETLQQFRDGVPKTPNGKSQDYFVSFLTETSFGKFFDQNKAEIFYKQIRCGILHQAEIGGSSRVLIRQQAPLIRLAKDGNGLVINRKLFHKQLAKEFENYVSQLRKTNSPDEKLRSNFKKKMDYICYVLYFAYGSNMDPKQMKERGAPFTKRKHAVLKGYILKFNKKATGKKAKPGEGKGNVVPDSHTIVEGVLYDITQSVLDRLDDKEGSPKHYDRKEMYVYLDDGTKVKAWVHIAQPSMVEDGLKPTKEYLSHYLKGKDLLSPTYYQWLEKVETLD